MEISLDLKYMYLTDRQTARQIDRQTDRQIETDRQTDRRCSSIAKRPNKSREESNEHLPVEEVVRLVPLVFEHFGR